MLQGLDDWRGMLRYSDHHTGDAGAMRREACRMKLEGIVCKQADAPYRAGRGHGWLKVKCQGREEFIVLGWTPPRGSRTGLGALHLGYYDPNGGLHYAGGVGTGFSDAELAPLRDALTRWPPTRRAACWWPAIRLDKTIHWVRPELVAEIQFVVLVRQRPGAPRGVSRAARGQGGQRGGASRRRPRSDAGASTEAAGRSAGAQETGHRDAAKQRDAAAPPPEQQQRHRHRARTQSAAPDDRRRSP